MASKYYFAILEKGSNKVVVQSEPRATRDFVDIVIKRLGEKGVGFFRGTSHVQNDARAALEEAVFELKAQVKPS